MATCAECVHVEVCKDYISSLLEGLELDKSDVELINKELNQDDADKGACEHFLDRARVAALPCKVGGDCFFVNQNGTIQRATLERVYMFSTSTELFLNDGREIYSTSLNESNIELFPTYEAAEQVLKERENNEG